MMYHIDLWILKNPCFPGINHTLSWCMILLMYFWIWFASILLRIFASAVRQCKFSSVAQLCLTLCEPMDWRMLGFSARHRLPELAQTRVYWVSDDIQPSHPLLSPSPPAFNLPSIRVFSNESALRIRWPKYWSFSFSISPSNECSGLRFRIDWFELLAVQGTLKSLLQHHSS